MRPFAGNGTSFHVVTFYHLKASWLLLRACRGKKVFGFFALLVSLSPFPFSFPSPFSCPFSVLLYTVVLLEPDLELSSTLTWKFTLLSARYPRVFSALCPAWQFLLWRMRPQRPPAWGVVNSPFLHSFLSPQFPIRSFCTTQMLWMQSTACCPHSQVRHQKYLDWIPTLLPLI